MIENIHQAAYLRTSELIRSLNAGAIQRLHEICRRGRKAGLFRRNIKPLELHWQISALSFFNVSNRATFSRIFGPTLYNETGQQALKSYVVDMVLRFVLR
jgi:hypothetical protein